MTSGRAVRISSMKAGMRVASRFKSRHVICTGILREAKYSSKPFSTSVMPRKVMA